ncbi:MAG: TraC family protein [Salinisphaeraceae bacterium]
MSSAADYCDGAYKKLSYRDEIPFSEMLDAFAYSSSDRIFATTDYRLACVWEIEMISREQATESDMAMISNGLAHLIDQFPDETIGQFMRVSTSDIEETVSKFESSTAKATFAPEVSQSIAALQRRGAKSGFLTTVPQEAVLASMKEEWEELRQMGLTEEDEWDESRSRDDHSIRGRAGRYAMRHRFFLVFAMDSKFAHNGVVQGALNRVRSVLNPKTGAKLYADAFQRHREVFLDHVDRIERSMGGMGFQNERVTGQGLIDVVFSLLNPERSKVQRAPRYSGLTPLRELVGRRDPENVVGDGNISKYMAMSTVETSDDGWEIEGHTYRVTSMKHMAEEPKPHLLMNALSETEGEGWSCFNFRVCDQRRIRMVVRMRKGIQSSGEDAKPKKGFFSGDKIKESKVAEDLANLDNATNPEEPHRRKVVDASVHVVCRDASRDRANRRARALESLLWESGYREELRGDAVIHSTLPLNFRAPSQRMLRRWTRMLSVNMTDLIPAYSAFPGFSDGRLLMNNSDGTPINLDPFTKYTAAPHQLVVGGTGTGKSFLVNALTMQMRVQYAPKTIIIDKGRSFEALCESMGGQYIYLVASEDEEGRKPICLNPLHISEEEGAVIAREPTGDEIEYMQDVIVAMCKSGTADEGGKTEPLKKAHKNLIQAVLIRLFRKRELGQELTMTDFCTEMNKEGDEGLSITRRMSEFTQDGIYGRMFDGELDVDWDNPMIVIETERFADRQAMDVVMLAILNQIDQYMKYRLPANMRKMLVIDEAWRVLANHARAVGQIYREARKYNCSISLISQSIRDFMRIVQAEGDADDGILANTNHFYFLGSNPADRKGAKELLEITEQEEAIWRNNLSVTPFYTEFLYLARTTDNRNYTGSVRLYSNPVTLWLSSTQPDDRTMREDRINAYLKKGLEPQEARRRAIVELAEEYPYGSRYEYRLAA